MVFSVGARQYQGFLKVRGGAGKNCVEGREEHEGKNILVPILD